MGKLTNYTAQIQAPDTSFQRATPESMGSAVGAGLEALGKGTQHFYSQMEEDEARTALVANAQIRADAAAELDEAQASGAPTDTIKQKMQDRLSAVGENFSTKKGFQSLALHSAQTNMMFDEQASRIAVHRASETAVLQGQQFLQSQSKVLRSNPSALPIVLRNTDDFIETVNASPTKRALMAQDLKTQFNMAAVMSSARIDPPGTKQWLIDGEWDLTPKEREQGVAETETQMRAIRADERNKRAIAEFDKHQASEKARDALYVGITNNTTEKDDILYNGDLLPPTREHLINVLNKHAQDILHPVRTDPAVFNDLRAKIDLPFGSPNKLVDPEVIWQQYGTKLSEADAVRLTKRITDNKTEDGQTWAAAESEFLRNMRPELDKSTLRGSHS